MKRDSKSKDSLAYQDSVTAPLDRAFDEDDAGGDGSDDDGNKENENPSVSFSSAIRKVSSYCIFGDQMLH